jgi:hypothetical protein
MYFCTVLSVKRCCGSKGRIRKVYKSSSASRMRFLRPTGGNSTRASWQSRCRKYVVHNREFASLFRFVAPAGRDHTPNTVLQPLILTWVRWTGWSLPESNIVDHVNLITVTIGQYTGEDLFVTGRSYQGEGRSNNGGTHLEGGHRKGINIA